MIDWAEARNMWRDGFDTMEIAEELGASEAEIYNGLSKAEPAEVAA